MMLPRPAVWFVLACLFAVTVLATPHLRLAGDSTMANKSHEPPNPETGWGEMLPHYFKDPSVVVNYAKNGRSTKSFIDEGLWQKLLDELQPDDWVIIQFGHNDAKSADPKRFAAPRDGYEKNLQRFIADVRAKGAHPILATSVARRKWDASGRLVDTHGDYVVVAREVAAAEHVPLLDLNRLTSALEEGHGVEGSKRLHLWIPAGAYERKPAGWHDDTHYSAYGADRVAALAVQEIIRLDLPLVAWLK